MTIEIWRANIEWFGICVSCGRAAEVTSVLLPSVGGVSALYDVPFCSRCAVALADNRRSRPRNVLLGLLGFGPATLLYFAIAIIVKSPTTAIWAANLFAAVWFSLFTVGSYGRRKLSAIKYGQSGVYHAGHVLRSDATAPCFVISLRNRVVAEETRRLNDGRRRWPLVIGA
jgi:hypothetical protein